MREKGFTLIELMIVVAIIAVIAAIAIPSLLGARITSDEAAASACLRTYAGAQNMYRRSDYDDDLMFEYAFPFPELNTRVKGGQPIRLIDDAFAAASRDNSPTGTPTAKAGYLFVDLVADASGGEAYAPDGTNYVAGYGLCAVPEVYNRTGRNTFCINIQGTVYQRDTGDNTGRTDFPDAANEGWIAVGG